MMKETEDIKIVQFHLTLLFMQSSYTINSGRKVEQGVVFSYCSTDRLPAWSFIRVSSVHVVTCSSVSSMLRSTEYNNQRGRLLYLQW